MDRNFKGDWEDKILGVIPSSIDVVKNKLGNELYQYKATKSVVNDSFNEINNADVFNNQVANENQNVRVRKMEAPSYNSNKLNSSNNGYQNQTPNYPNNYNSYSGGYSNSDMGAVHTLILVSTVALVMLVVFVTLFAINYLGL